MAEKTTAFTGPIVVGLNDKKGEIRLTDGKNVNEAKYLSIAAPDNITSDTTLTFPNGAGTAGQILSTDGNGGLSWVNDSAGNPAGTNGQVQTNDGGTFGAISEGTSGQILTSNGAGSAPTFQAATSGIAAVVDDTTPQLGGDLESNGHDIDFADDDKAKFGSSGDLEIFHDGSNSYIKETGTGNLVMNTNNLVVQNAAGTANLINAPEGAAGLDLYYNGNIKLSTSNTGIQTTGTVNVNGTYSLPTSDGTANQVMTTDGAGNVTFQNAAAADPITSSLDVGPTKTIKLDAVFPDGTRNSFLGENAGANITTGDSNVGIGFGALENNTGGNENIAIGRAALDAGSPSSSIAIGGNAASSTVGSNNVCIGAGAASNMSAFSSENVIIGRAAANGSVSGVTNSVIIGDIACINNAPSDCVAIGAGTMASTSGQYNTAVGQSSGSSIGTGTNNTCLGHNADPSTTGVSNEITLGDAAVSTLRCQTTSITSLSDARDKKDVEDANIGLDFINDLRPVKFVWDTRDGAKKDIKEVGFIAQELDEVQQKHGVEDHLQLVLKNNPDKLEASQGKLIPILVQAIKDLKKEIDELKKA